MNIIAIDNDRIALQVLANTIKETLNNINLREFRDGSAALDFIKNHPCDIVFLDINIGNTDGILLAKQLKGLYPRINIIFISEHTEFAMDAFSVHASGYLRKPIFKEQILNEILNLRYPVSALSLPVLRVQTFGHFEVFANEKLLHFAHSKAKELFALLVDRRGAGLTTPEISAILWENEPYSVMQKNKVQKAIMQMRNTLSYANCVDILQKEHNSTAVKTDMIFCDYYECLKGNKEFTQTFAGEYMVQYSWAEPTGAFLYALTLK